MVKLYSKHKGFTLVELVVSIGIMGVILALSLFNTRKFSDAVALKSAGQDVSIALRQAQTYGTSVKETTPGSGVFNNAYGMWFDKNNPTKIILFSDTNADGSFDGSVSCSGNDECREALSLRSGVTISDLCGVHANGNESCFGNSTKTLAVTFLRPNADARIKFGNNNGNGSPYVSAYVLLVSQQGSTMKVSISTAGQITVQ